VVAAAGVALAAGPADMFSASFWQTMGAAGPRGEQGPQGERGPAGPAPSSWTWTYNGVTYTCTPSSDGS
ncbi:hypothetical protein KBZ21_55200, partial [Streptomyces sp. A73]|nr:hypothetical protein [Streptomyces sp. A73]